VTTGPSATVRGSSSSRHLYLWRRSSPYPSLISFDAPSPRILAAFETRPHQPATPGWPLLGDPVYLQPQQKPPGKLSRNKVLPTVVTHGVAPRLRRAPVRRAQCRRGDHCTHTLPGASCAVAATIAKLRWPSLAMQTSSGGDAARHRTDGGGERVAQPR
jgi:hypothetical protein